MSAEKPILQVKNLTTKFRTARGLVTAVDNVSFDVFKGKSLGIVGESGSGKSVTALSIMRLIQTPPGLIAGGEVFFEGKDILKLQDWEMRTIRGNKIGMIFQEPMTSLNPVFTVGNQISEVVALHQKLNRAECRDKSIEMLQLVGIPSPTKRVNEYPHQLSGGMRQRVMIAMALACNPSILIADEPTTALDVTIQAQILELMQKLQSDLGMGIILITHDLGVVAEVCEEIAVMYCGRIVEKADAKNLFYSARHPYTKGLMDSIPHFDSTTDEVKGRLKTIEGIVPSLINLPEGCYFQDRCFKTQDKCRNRNQRPELENCGGPKQWVSCYYPLDVVERTL